MRIAQLRFLLLAALLLASTAVLAQTIDLNLPAPSQELSVETQADATYRLSDEAAAAIEHAEFDGNDLLLGFREVV